jgi:DNA-binding IclR family transcriptional regulator
MARVESILSLHKAVNILLLLQQEGEMGVTEIARSLDMNKSTVHRILSTLQDRSLIRQNAVTGKYWLGLKLYSLGMTVRENLPIQSIAAPYLKVLSDKFNEVVNLSVLDMSSVNFPRLMILDKIQTSQILKLTPSLGSGTPCHCSAMGKCLLAFSPDEYIEKLTSQPLQQYTSKTIINWTDFRQELEDIREKGYAIEDQEMEKGLTCVGAPILNKKQEIIAAISLSGPTSRMNESILSEMIEEIKKAAREISVQIN